MIEALDICNNSKEPQVNTLQEICQTYVIEIDNSSELSIPTI